MKVLHVIASLSPRYGGPSTALPEMCRALAARGHAVEVFTTDIDGPGRLRAPIGTPIVARGVKTTFYAVGRPRTYKPSFGLARALLQRVRDFDLVHIHSLYLFHGAVAGVLCRRFGVPYLIRPHGTLDDYHRRQHRGRKALYMALIERRNLDGAAGIHCTSAAEAAAVAAARVRAPRFVAPLGVDVGAFEQAAEPAELLRRHPELIGRRWLTFLGRITLKKGPDVLVDAFARIAVTRANAHLVIAGPDDEGLGASIRSRLSARGLERRASLVGMVAGREKVGLLQRSAAFALPSRDENFAVTVVEAMAAGTPVVISDGVGIHEEVSAAGAGLVVPRTAAAVADALARLFDDPPFATRCGERGRALARTAFSWERAAAQLEAAYRKVVVSGSRAPHVDAARAGGA